MRVSYILFILMMLYCFFFLLPYLIPILLLLVIVGYIKVRKLRREMNTFQEYSFHEQSYQGQESSIHNDVIDVEFTEREE